MSVAQLEFSIDSGQCDRNALQAFPVMNRQRRRAAEQSHRKST